ncbi:MAG: DUF5752 family protein [Candidatus Bathyarchaeia archaeon]
MSEGKLTKETAANILRSLPEENAFVFHKPTSEPLGLSARSLSEFSDLLKSADPSSVKYHVDRGDFESWIRMLGDETLAKQIASVRIKGLQEEDLKLQITRLVRLRLGRLRKAASI